MGLFTPIAASSVRLFRFNAPSHYDAACHPKLILNRVSKLSHDVVSWEQQASNAWFENGVFSVDCISTLPFSKSPETCSGRTLHARPASLSPFVSYLFYTFGQAALTT